MTMENALLEVVPNFSEGRDEETVQRLKDVFIASEEVAFLDHHVDEDHNRTVITAVGSAVPLVDVMEECITEAVDTINVFENLDGTHPCLGSADVVPFVPIENSTMADARRAAEQLSDRVASSINLPVFLYGEAARKPWRENLAWIREPGMQELRSRIGSHPIWQPDFGPSEFHESGGVSCIGARDFLIAFNVDLVEGTLRDARRLSGDVRESSGGLPAVQALGMELERQDRIIVSLNLLNFRRTSLYTVLNTLREKAQERDVKLGPTELVGLLPEEAVRDGDPDQLNIPEFDPEQHILEQRVENIST